MRFAGGLCGWILITLALVAGAQQITVTVRVEPSFGVGIALDGDTVRIPALTDAQELWLADRGVESVRMICVAAPEKNEPGGLAAKAWLAQQLTAGPVELEPGPDRRDNFGRILAFVRVAGRDLNLESVRTGMARADRAYPCAKRAEYLAAELEAQAAGRGLWRLTD